MEIYLLLASLAWRDVLLPPLRGDLFLLFRLCHQLLIVRDQVVGGFLLCSLNSPHEDSKNPAEMMNDNGIQISEYWSNFMRLLTICGCVDACAF